MSDVIRIGMWSGPRNISTALMRSWGNRADAAVVDEPFYAHYLIRTGLDHPGREAVIAGQEDDWTVVAQELTEGDAGGARLQYQKHMAHHLFEDMQGDWLLALRSVMLVRDPAAMLVSLAKVLGSPSLADTGLAQQLRLARWLTAELGEPPLAIDSRSILEDPRGALGALCAALELPFDEAMLSWPAGARDTDGVWAPHWYAGVEASTGFAPYQPLIEPVPSHLAGVRSQCEELHAELLTLCEPISLRRD